MSRVILRALMRDAYLQVIDNRVFRILVVLLLLFVLPTFIVAAKSDELVILWTWHFSYEEVLGAFDVAPGEIEPQKLLINGFQTLIVDQIAGAFGVLFSLAATAFFLPRMLEKGSADTVFSKPVSRFVLMLSRYFAGLVFVLALAVCLIGGMHVGLLLCSGYSDWGFLFSILTLVVVFSVVHAVSILVGVFTRSSVAAILVALLFYGLNGGVHTAWKFWTMADERTAVMREALEESEAAESLEELGAFLTALRKGIDVAHLVLPKTTEMDVLAQSVRRQFGAIGTELTLDELGLSIERPPRDFERVADTKLDSGGIVWQPEGSEGAALATLTLTRRDLEVGESRLGAARKREKELARLAPELELELSKADLGNIKSSLLAWTEAREEGGRARRIWFFSVSRTLFLLELDADAAWYLEEENERTVRWFGYRINILEDHDGPFSLGLDAWGRRYGWFNPMPFNFCFSVGSTLAFIVLTLLLARWRLNRIDF